MEDGLESKKPLQKGKVGSPGSWSQGRGRDATDEQCEKRIYILQTLLVERGVFPSVRQQGLHSGISTAPTKGKAPLAAIQHAKDEQGCSPGTGKGDSQLYSPVVNLAEAAASLLL